jgi:hypothetical protein
MPKPSKETQDALMAVLGPKTDRWRCVALGLPEHWRGTIGRIRNGFAVSLSKENEVRYRLGLPAIYPPLVPVPPCPDCGSVHHARCNGHEGAVVVLAPGETVRRPGQSKPRRRYYRPCLPVALTPAQRRQIVAFALELAGPAPKGTVL